jgi:hypothetical protein
MKSSFMPQCVLKWHAHYASGLLTYAIAMVLFSLLGKAGYKSPKKRDVLLLRSI